MSDNEDDKRFPPPEEETERDGLVVTQNKPRTERPSLYKVVLLNDDFTPMDFVILILKKFFLKSDPEAAQIMLQVHTDGAGLAGIYTYEMAETKVYSVNEFSRRHKHPLKCIMEKE
jgi:ATP-dependent Clp protease adaptor protein ClpS